jgi:hypothetical protein
MVLRGGVSTNRESQHYLQVPENFPGIFDCEFKFCSQRLDFRCREKQIREWKGK